MSWRRHLMFLMVIAVAASTLAGSAWAHSGHESMDASMAGTTMGLPRADLSVENSPGRPPVPPRHHVPSAVALLTGAVAFLASLPHRRRTVALVLCALLALIAFEGAAHAALHLRHVPHAGGLVIGSSATQQAVADLDGLVPTVSPLVVLGAAIEHTVAPVPNATAATYQGRAPPFPLA